MAEDDESGEQAESVTPAVGIHDDLVAAFQAEHPEKGAGIGRTGAALMVTDALLGIAHTLSEIRDELQMIRGKVAGHKGPELFKRN